MELLNRQEVKEIDQLVIRQGQPQAALIESVGAKLSQWLHPKIGTDEKVMVLMGPGHNGDDAAVVYRRLCRHNKNIHGLKINEENSPFIDSGAELYTLNDLTQLDFYKYDWIIDGLFGTGLDRRFTSEIQRLIDRVNQVSATRVAIDVPTGINSDTGEIFNMAFRADHTLTIAAPKRGMYLLPARNFCGDIHVMDISVLNKGLQNRKINTLALPHFDFLELKPNRDTHKYERGQVAVALSQDYPGAGLMVALAAQKAGAGYVRVYCPQELILSLQLQYPFLVFTSYEDLTDLWQKLDDDDFDCLAAGSGWKEQFPKTFVSNTKNKKFVFDGGFLTKETLKKTSKFASQVILTPHFGELQKLTSSEKSCKWSLVENVTRNWKGVILGKGYDTLIAQNGTPFWLTTWNSTSLATAGSGDILCGITAALVCQTGSLRQAAAMAVDAHRRLAEGYPVSISPATLLDRIEAVLNTPDKLSLHETP